MKHLMRHPALIVSLLVLASLPGCADPGKPSVKASNKVITGLDDSIHTFVVGTAIRLDSSIPWNDKNRVRDCSGTFVAPHWIMTAAHCIPFCDASIKTTGCLYSGWTGTPFLGRDGPLYASYANGNQQLLNYNSANLYTLDYVFFPRPSDWPLAPGENHDQLIPDVALVHTVEPSAARCAGGSDGPGCSYLPLMENGEMPTSRPTPPGTGKAIADYVSQQVTVVGYSNNPKPEGVSQCDASIPGPSGLRRRYGHMIVAGTNSPVDFKLTHLSLLVMSGDSGGAVIFDVGGVKKLGGVISRGPACQPIHNPAYIPRPFVNRLCPRLAPKDRWEKCLDPSDPPPDRDFDGIPDTTDLSPDYANASQRNCNHNMAGNDERDSPSDIQLNKKIEGDAKDPWACPWIPNKKLLEGGKSCSSAGGTLWNCISKKAIIPLRGSGYQKSTPMSIPGLDPGEQESVLPRYCACHDPARSTEAVPIQYDYQYCKDSICKHDGSLSNFSIHSDTGWQVLLWSTRDWNGSAWVDDACQRVNTDVDGNYNECSDATKWVDNQMFHHLHGGPPPVCIESSLPGCDPTRDDFESFWQWQAGARTHSITWDWMDQDYPHDSGDPPGSKKYNPALTVKARVRNWLRPKEIDDQGSTHIATNNFYTDVQDFEPFQELELGKQLYDPPPFRWVLPAFPDPRLPTLLIALVPREVDPSELPEGFSWLPESSTAATRAVMISPLEAEQARFGEVTSSTWPGQGAEPNISGAGMAQIDDLVFALGGQDGGDTLSNAMWAVMPDAIGKFQWVEVGGGSQAASSSSSTTSSSLAAAPVSFAAWRIKALAKVAKKAAATSTAWTALKAKAKFAPKPYPSTKTQKKTGSPDAGVGGATSSTQAMSTLTVGGPAPQMQGVLAPNHEGFPPVSG